MEAGEVVNEIATATFVIWCALGAAAFIAWVGVIAHRELSRPPLLPLPARKQWVRQCGPRSRELCRK
ncbi:MAG: hypothetical protein QG672_267 [Pseudomonadota bacterium]|nr:hypothetical protein [Pseudomonadota bacterium]